MAPGCDGMVDTVAVIVRGVLVPHELPAVTETVPPAGPTVQVIEFVEELPDHPEGSDQVYKVAPETAEMLYTCMVP